MSEATTDPRARNVDRSIRRHLRWGIATTILLVGGFGGWAATAELAGAVIAPGAVVVDSGLLKVQHPSGGVVGEILVEDGSEVKAGDVVMRLDATMARSNLGILDSQLVALKARRARLVGETQGVAALVGVADETPESQEAFRAEAAVLAAAIMTRTGQKSQLEERIKQLELERAGLLEQASAKEREREVVIAELDGLRRLKSERLIAQSRVNLLERDAVKLEGEAAQLRTAAVQADGKMSETRLQILQIDNDARTKAGELLRDTEARVAELEERRVAALDILSRVDVRAPADGVIHALSVRTVGGVIQPGEQLMLIVPHLRRIVIDTRVAPNDIDQLVPGQLTAVRLTAFNMHTTPELAGSVQRISAEVMRDETTGMTFYTARIAVPEDEVAKLGLPVLPGMPAEAHIRTASRTPLDYLMQPITDQLSRTMRE